MKQFFIGALLLVTAAYSNAQNIYSGNVEFDKTTQQGTIAEYNYTEDLVSNVLISEIEKSAGKSKSVKGFQLFKGVHINEISPDAIDLYVKIDRKSKKEKDKSVVYVLVSKGYDNFVTTASDASVFDNTKTFLQNITTKFAASDLSSQITEQEKLVKKEQKKLDGYSDDIKDMEKKIRKLNDDIEDRKKDIEKQKSEVSKQQGILDVLKSKQQ